MDYLAELETEQKANKLLQKQLDMAKEILADQEIHLRQLHESLDLYKKTHLEISSQLSKTIKLTRDYL